MFKNKKIVAKIGLLSGILVLFMLLSAGYCIYQMKSIGNEISEIAERDLPLD